ncbi:MAG: hypothetical protein KatS3mg032_0947 [Cyclobacteriaceae bacterium]|nr:MAG: hypothetical protein KatS3mg032_0947 [Cyclobacteriaceae bacterium]
MRAVVITAVLLTALVAKAQKRQSYYYAEIRLVNGEQVYGRWVYADSAGVAIQLPADTLLLKPEEVLQINIRRSNASVRYALLGAATGFAIGFGAGWLEYDDRHQGDINHIGRAAGTGLLASFVGAFAGFAYGRIPKDYHIGGSKMLYLRQLSRFRRFNH